MAKKQYVVACERHGKDSMSWAGKQVVVPEPKTRSLAMNFGCPYCKKDLRAKAKGS